MQRSLTSNLGPRAQRGISLVTGLIMLILLTLLAISAFQASNVNLRVAGNMQVRQESLAATQTAIERVLSSPAFIDLTTPPAADTVALNGASYTVNFTPAPACRIGWYRPRCSSAVTDRSPPIGPPAPRTGGGSSPPP